MLIIIIKYIFIVGFENISQNLLKEKNPIKYVENLFKIPYFIYNDEQKNILIKKLILYCDIIGQHSNNLRIYLEEKIKNTNSHQ